MESVFLSGTNVRKMRQKIPDIVTLQNSFFNGGNTLDVEYRIKKLKDLLAAILQNEKAISDGLYQDFKKPPFEAILAEVLFVVRELKWAIKNIRKYARPKRVRPYLLNFPSSDFIYYQPYGNVLIIAPFNYPFQLALLPLIGAVAAGNTALLKPSEHTPHTNKVLGKIISDVFPTEYVTVVEGDANVSQELLQQKWDYIFFTGSVQVGKIVAQAAASRLTPVTLELGGKNPCIVDETAPIALAARRIVFGKFLNAGQTCIAPDYILVKEQVQNDLVSALIIEIENFYGSNPQKSPDYARIVNENHFQRITAMLQGQNIVFGGITDVEDLYVSPTLVLDSPLDSLVMQEEIFGPVLPILSYKTFEEAEAVINRHSHPLAFYFFSKNRLEQENFLKKIPSGGVTINDTVVHYANPNLPFGGVGNSGLGEYGASFSIETFSHKKAVVKRKNWLDIRFRYAPYGKKLNLLKKLLKRI